MIPVVMTFLLLSCFDGWLRHGCKLELTPCSNWSTHKLCLLLQRVKARISITSNIFWLPLSEGVEERLFLQACRGKVGLQHLCICTDVHQKHP